MEIWKDVKNHEEFYEINNYGIIRNKITNKVLIGDINSAGYRRVILYNPIKTRYFIHRLVAMHFCDNYHDGYVVNHKDGNKLNNRADNLEWVTRSENDIHAFKNNLRKVTGIALIQIEKSKKPILLMSLDGEQLFAFKNVKKCAKFFNVETATILKYIRKQEVFHNKYKLYRIETKTY